MFIFLGIIVLIVLWVIAVYNGLVRHKARAEEAWADIGVQLKRRYDLIPNLVETVKGYASHEQSTLDKVIAARNQAMQGAGNPEQVALNEATMTGALKSLFALSESYPDLKANQNFLELQRELSDTENKIQASRRFYNGNVRDLNIAIDMFPGNMIAGMFNFVKKEYFNVEENGPEQAPVAVKF